MRGLYVSRQLSNAGVVVREHVVDPSINFLCCYRRATELVIFLDQYKKWHIYFAVSLVCNNRFLYIILVVAPVRLHES